MMFLTLLVPLIIVGLFLIIPNYYRSQGKQSPKKFMVITAIIAIAATAWTVVTLKLGNSFDFAQNGWTQEAISWRVQLLARKGKGEVPDLSWRELWFMMRSRGGFGLGGTVQEGFSVEGTVNNPYITPSDRQIGAAIFRERCAACHGGEGMGAYAPRLSRERLSHGDSDFAIYKIIRDGIPQTGMAAVAMSPLERWRLVGYLRTLQLANTKSTEEVLPVDVQVSNEQIRAAGTNPEQWLTYSGSLDGHRYTPLTEINAENVSRLRIRWIQQFEATGPRSESTPIVVGGVIFSTEPTPSDVVAVDAKSGKVRWRYRRSLPDKLPACCGRSNRGLAVLGNTLFLASLDGYLVAIDASNGTAIWQTQVANPSEGYTMSGAPLIVNGTVVTGVAGAEFGIRGFLAAYEPTTGRQLWKFNTIPGPGEFGHDSWKNDAWRTGGAPTWVTGSYDPSLDLIYWGTGNPAPGFNGDVRPGDNLFSDSIIALHGSSGKLAWYFQFTPHDVHDFDATQTPILTELPIKGVLRRVVCIANRNGFYYVLDRATGEYLLGVAYVDQNWAKGLDSAGRPIPSSDTEIVRSGRLTKPGVGGGTNWQNATFDPKRAMIVIPATEGASVFTTAPRPGRGMLGFYPGSSGGDYEVPQQRAVRALDAATGVKKWERWERSLPNWKNSSLEGFSGLLATGGGLVFGASRGYAFAINSENGRELWRVYLGGDTIAPPISFTVDGHQVILMWAGRSLFEFAL